jgi:salicylate hydroxylase
MSTRPSSLTPSETRNHPDNIVKALNSYQTQRVLRTARVQLMSRAIGDNILHASGAHAALRNSVMTAKPNQDWYNTLAWLYGGPSTQGPQKVPVAATA